jgi:folate-binding protein YgfZ
MMDAHLFDLSDRTQIEVTGRDRVKFLHSFCTNDIKKLQPGQGCEAFVTNVNGKVLGHIFVFAERDSLWIESITGAAATLLPHFDKYVITEDVRFTDRTAEFAELLLAGPSATELLERLGLSVAALPLYGHLSHGSDALPLRSVRRVDWFDSSTWLLSLPVAQRDAVERSLTQAGAREADVAEVHAARIAAGFPIYGIDISEDNLAQEVGRTSLAISFTKGCYLGQEPIARIDAMGHVNRQLCRIEVSSGPLPDAGTPILDKPAPDGKPIGAITSSAGKWRGDDKPLALAYLRSGFAKVGSQVIVDGREARVF